MLKPKENIRTVHKKVVVPFVDMILGRTMSKKLMVFIIATTFLLLTYLKSHEWVEIAKIYVTGQSAVDLAMAIKGNKNDHKRDDTRAR